MFQDEVLFADESSEIKNNEHSTWKILIADDDYEVHAVTRLVMGGIEYEGKRISVVSTYSGSETMEYIKNNPDIAVVLLDVVMESDDAGIRVVRYVREVLKNKNIRIILRTGQPGQAPERSVISGFDINDYKEKAELTAQKLYSTVITSLRSYRDILTIDNSKKSMEKIIHKSKELYLYPRPIKEFAKIVAADVNELIGREMSILFLTKYNNSYKARDEYEVIFSSGDYSNLSLNILGKDLGRIMGFNIDDVISEDGTQIYDSTLITSFCVLNKLKNVIIVKDSDMLNEMEKNILAIYKTNIASALENICIEEEFIQNEKLAFMGKMAGNITTAITGPLSVLHKNITLLEDKMDMISKKYTEIKDPERLKELENTIKDIEKGIDDTKNIITHMIAYVTENKEEIIKYDLYEACTSAVAFIKNDMALSDWKVNIRNAEKIYCRGIRGEIVQAIINILLFVYEKSSINAGDVEIDIERKGGYARISLNVVEIKNVDELLAKYEQSLRKSSSLDVVYLIIRNNNGTLSVKKVDNSSAVFEIELQYIE